MEPLCTVRLRTRSLSLVTAVPVSGISDYCSRSRKKGRSQVPTLRSKNRHQLLHAVFHLSQTVFSQCSEVCLHAWRVRMTGAAMRGDRLEKLFTLNVLQPANISIYCNVRFFSRSPFSAACSTVENWLPFPFSEQRYYRIEDSNNKMHQKK